MLYVAPQHLASMTYTATLLHLRAHANIVIRYVSQSCYREEGGGGELERERELSESMSEVGIKKKRVEVVNTR